MQAYRYTGTLDLEGRIIPSEPIILTEGEEFEFVLWPVELTEKTAVAQPPSPEESQPEDAEPLSNFSHLPSNINILKEWFAEADKATGKFEVASELDEEDELRWDALREKHNL